MSSKSFVEISGEQIHDAWRSVRRFDPAYVDDPRLCRDYAESADHQGLCEVTGGIIDHAIVGQQLRTANFDTKFVRETMEQVYDGYIRYTVCINGLRRSGYDWFRERSIKGPQAIRLKPPYSTLSHAAKEIDRRMVVLGLNNLPDNQLATLDRETIRLDADAILHSAHSGKVYDYSIGFAYHASFD